MVLPRDVKSRFRGRGAVSNPTGRFESRAHESFDDGWTQPEEPQDDEPPRLDTTIIPEQTREAISRNDSPDIGFDRSINPYKGCEHGCVYCFARPTHSYLGLSPGLDFETKIFSKPDAPEKLREALSKPSYRPDVIVLGANTDPYQPVERELGISRRILEVLRDFRHPVGILTKSSLVLRDVDILAEMARDELVQVFVSVTTLDRELWRVMEPRAARPDRRVDTIRQLNAAGVPASVLAAPMIPKINDHELEHILESCAAAGATNAGYVLLRLPHELKELFTDWLQASFPLRAEHVLSTVRDTRDGKLYDSRWGVRGRGTGPYAQLLERRFELACKRLGLNRVRRVLAVDKFRVPPKAGDQLQLF